jgi:PIN domain nuclease of toxin-antitoxin system
MECEIVDVTMIHALIVAKLRPLTKALGLSLGDRTCLALAIERDCPAMTADRNWAKLNIGVPIQLIR